MIGPGEAAVEGEVLLHHAGAEGDGGRRHVDAQAMVREAHRDAEGVAHRGHRAQVHAARRRRVEGGALEQDDVAVAGGGASTERVGDVLVAGEAGGEDHGTAPGRRMADEGQVHDLEGRDLVRRDAKCG